MIHHQHHRKPTVVRQDLEAAQKDVAQGSVSLVFILRDPADKHGPFRPMHVQMHNSVARQFRQTFEKLIARILSAQDLKIGPFQFGATAGPGPSNGAPVLEAIACAEVPALDALITLIGDGGAPPLPVVTAIDGQCLDSLWAYALVVSFEDRRLYYFRKFKPARVIRVGGWLRLIYHKGVLRAVQDDAFNFDEEADTIVVGTDALVLQRAYFEEIFDFVQDLYQPAAKKAVEHTKLTALLSDPMAFLEICERDSRKLRKLAAITERIDLTQLTWDRVVDVATRWNVPVELDSDHQKVNVTPGTAWSILRLLDDDYLSSEVTGKLYEVEAKRFVGRWSARHTKGSKHLPGTFVPPPGPEKRSQPSPKDLM